MKRRAVAGSTDASGSCFPKRDSSHVAAVSLTRKRLLAIGFIIAAGLAAMLVDLLVVTENEQIHGVIEALHDAVGRADVDALVAHVSEDYDTMGLTLDELRVLADAFFKRYGPVRLRHFRVQANRIGDVAIATVSGIASGQEERYAPILGHSVWEIQLRKESDGAWRVTSIAPVQIDRTEVSSWGELRRLEGL